MEVFIGPIIHSVLRDQVCLVQNGYIVSLDGKILEVNESVNLPRLKKQYPDAKLTILEDGQFLIPGLIDSHIHAPQFPNAGLGYDKPLLEWLEAYTFPLETLYADVNLAKSIYKNVVSSLVAPVVTPRFAVSCTAPLLAQLGEIANKRNLHVQTHLSENKGEVEFVRKSFPKAKNYTDVYDSAKLLTKRTILAHSVFLSEDELAVIKARCSSVAHCANSNFLLHSGLCDVRRILDAGVNVAMGTDVAGGCSSSVLDAIRSALTASSCLSFARPGYKPLTYHEAFYLATMGGAIALDMEDKLGNFEAGKFFDAIIVDTKIPDSPIFQHSQLSLSELFQKFIYTGDDRNIVKVYVNGKLVVDKS